MLDLAFWVEVAVWHTFSNLARQQFSKIHKEYLITMIYWVFVSL